MIGLGLKGSPCLDWGLRVPSIIPSSSSFSTSSSYPSSLPSPSSSSSTLFSEAGTGTSCRSHHWQIHPHLFTCDLPQPPLFVYQCAYDLVGSPYALSSWTGFEEVGFLSFLHRHRHHVDSSSFSHSIGWEDFQT
jgi:hypothetical protein